MRLKAIIVGASVVLAAWAGTATAQDITYVGATVVGAATTSISIVTDGALGSLGYSDIIDFSAKITDPFGTSTLDSTTNSSISYVFGLTATASALTLNVYDSGFSGLALTEDGKFGAAGYNICGACALAPGTSNDAAAIDVNGAGGINDVNEKIIPYGETTIGTVSAAPELSTWFMMIAGVAMTGGMLRFGRRRGALAGA